MKIALCDSNANTRGEYAKLLFELSVINGLNAEIFQYESGEELVQAVEFFGDIDLVYVDVFLPDMSGAEVARQINEADFLGEVIFLTKSGEHFLDAFDVGAFNYVLKDTRSTVRFERVFDAFIQKYKEKEREYLVLNSCGETLNVALDDIYYVESSNRILTLHYKGGTFEFYSTMNGLAETLSGRNFMRVHQSYIVAIPYIEKLTSQKLLLESGAVVPVGRVYQTQLKDHWNEIVASRLKVNGGN